MLQPLKDAYVYYESKKLEEDLAKDDYDKTKVSSGITCPWLADSQSRGLNNVLWLVVYTILSPDLPGASRWEAETRKEVGGGGEEN